MFRNQYDNDITTWSPQGRIHQIEYAMESVKLGSACVGVKNKKHAVLVAIKRSASDLSGHLRKVYEIDNHIGVSITGLTSDARSLCRFMRSTCLDDKWAYDTPMAVKRLVGFVGEKLQRCTHYWGRRPYGVGLLVAGYDEEGPHIYQVDPSANYYDCKCMALGARSQSAKTYLEKNYDAILSTDNLDDLVTHGLKALRDCLPGDGELNMDNCTVAVVGEGMDFTTYDDEQVARFVELIREDAAAPPAEGQQAEMEQ